MNAKVLAPILAALIASPLSAPASPPQPTTITIDCAQPALPSQRAFARLTGIDNAGQAYDARARLMVQAQRACQGGAALVQVVNAPSATAPGTPLARADRAR